MAMGKEPGLNRRVNLREIRDGDVLCDEEVSLISTYRCKTFSIAFRCVWIPFTTVFYVDNVHLISLVLNSGIF